MKDQILKCSFFKILPAIANLADLTAMVKSILPPYSYFILLHIMVSVLSKHRRIPTALSRVYVRVNILRFTLKEYF